MDLLFREERALRAAAARARDLAATVKDPARRAGLIREAADLAERMPQSEAERLLLLLD